MHLTGVFVALVAIECIALSITVMCWVYVVAWGVLPWCCLHGAYVGHRACVVCAINGDV